MMLAERISNPNLLRVLEAQVEGKPKCYWRLMDKGAGPTWQAINDELEEEVEGYIFELDTVPPPTRLNLMPNETIIVANVGPFWFYLIGSYDEIYQFRKGYIL